MLPLWSRETPAYMGMVNLRVAMAHELDNVDRGILHLLQLDARNTTAQDVADKTGVSPSTIRNRIDQLEADGVITGYFPSIDYEAANISLQVLFAITAPPTERADAVDQLMDTKGVVEVRETVTGNRNIYAEAIGTSTADISRITDTIHDMGFEVESSEIIKQRQSQPFDHFHYEDDVAGGD